MQSKLPVHHQHSMSEDTKSFYVHKYFLWCFVISWNLIFFFNISFSLVLEVKMPFLKRIRASAIFLCKIPLCDRWCSYELPCWIRKAYSSLVTLMQNSCKNYIKIICFQQTFLNPRDQCGVHQNCHQWSQGWFFGNAVSPIL